MAKQTFNFGGLTVTWDEPALCCFIPDDQQKAARSGAPYKRCQAPAEWEITGAKEAGYPTLACTAHVGALLGDGLHYVTPWPDGPTATPAPVPTPPAKPSESSMVQRIEALEPAISFEPAPKHSEQSLMEENKRLKNGIGGLMRACKHLALATPDRVLRMELERAVGVARTLLHGPPDPERDRETRAEVLKP